MAEQPKIVFKDWTKGISVDEYAGGSFFYSEGIDTYNTKSFKIGPRNIEICLNERTNGLPIGSANTSDNNWIVFATADGYLENYQLYNGCSTNPVAGGGLYRRSTGTYTNILATGTTIIGISESKIDVIDIDSLRGTNIVTTPDLTSNTGWTVGSGWTTGATGAIHSTGVNNLSQTLTLTNARQYRIAVRCIGQTAGSCEVRLGTTVLGTITTTSDEWNLFVTTSPSTSEVLRFIPTTDFNGTISYVNTALYDNTKLLPDKVTITTANRHPAIFWEGDLYIGSGSKIDIVSTTLWDIRTFSIIDSGYTIQNIDQIGGTLIIWATNGEDSKQYYWNGIDEVASETIDRKGQTILCVASDEVKSYVLVSQYNNFMIYIVSGYTRKLIAKNWYEGRTTERSKIYYNKNKKFNFYAYGSNSMSIFNDTLYVNAYGGVYTYGSNFPGILPGWNKPIKLDEGYTLYCNKAHEGVMFYGYKKTTGNFIGYAREYYQHGSTGFVVTNPIFRDELSSRKDIKSLKIGYKNVKSTIGNIKIYAIVDDDYFYTFTVTGITTTPTAGAKYNIGLIGIDGSQVKGEVISTDITAGVGTILMKVYENQINYPGNILTTITKVSGIGDTNITWTGWNNMALIKIIESDGQEYGDEEIFSKNFIDIHMPYWRKLQLVIELNSNNFNVSPEIFDVNILSDIV